jgi:hypothetical protein
VNQDTKNLADIATAMSVARRAALQQSRRKQQIHHYWRNGPVPYTPTVYADNGAWDFPGSIQLEQQIIGLILDGAPAELFDWTDPPTPESLEHNRSAPHLWEYANRRPKPTPRKITNVNGATGYGLTALQDESDILAGAPSGERNDQLNMSAFNLGQLVGSDDLPEHVVTAELSALARSIGLDESEIGPTLRSGLSAGKAKPRCR